MVKNNSFEVKRLTVNFVKKSVSYIYIGLLISNKTVWICLSTKWSMSEGYV